MDTRTVEELNKLAEAATLVPKAATFDETVNDLAWRMHHFLMDNGATYDGRVFNNMKGFLRDTITEWVARSEMSSSMPAIPALIERVERAEAENARLKPAFDFLGEVQGVCLGVAMSGKDHPNPDGALMGLFEKAQAIFEGRQS